MAEPASSGAAGAVGWKLIGGLAGLGAIGAGLAAVVVMCMSRPQDDREWTVALISTVVSSIGGGAAVVQHFGLQRWVHEPTGLVAIFGLVFACGLPGWGFVRALFLWLNKRKDRDIAELAAEVRAQMKE